MSTVTNFHLMHLEAPEVLTENQINNEILIDSVESRPLLYNRFDREASNLPLKAKLWREVAKSVFTNVWWGLTERERKNAVQICQKRFKNLRACMCRELRTKRGSVQKRRRSYLYYEQMKFLLPYLDQREQTEDESLSALEETQDGIQIEDEVKQEQQISEAPSAPQDVGMPVKTAGEIVTNASDSETLYMLSLVPILRSVPQPQKLDAQIEIMSIFKKYVPGRTDQ